MLNQLCLNCGIKHRSGECKAKPDACSYRCSHCQSTVHVANNGSSTTTPRVRASVQVPTPPTTLLSSKRSAPAFVTQSSPPAKRAKTGSSSRCCHVVVLGLEYTSLGWYLGRTDPTPRERREVMAACSERRLEMDGGDTKTLKVRGFAKVSSPPELLPGRERLLSTPMATACLALKGAAPITVHRPGGKATGCRQALWLLSDLQKALPR